MESENFPLEPLEPLTLELSTSGNGLQSSSPEAIGLKESTDKESTASETNTENIKNATVDRVVRSNVPGVGQDRALELVEAMDRQYREERNSMELPSSDSTDSNISAIVLAADDNPFVRDSQGVPRKLVDGKGTPILGRVWGIIYPDNYLKNSWDIYMAILLVSLLFALPFEVAFNVGGEYGAYDGLVDGSFGLDMFMTFFTAIETSTGRMIVDHKHIAKTYLKSWFPLDIVSVFPFAQVLGSASSNAKLTSLFRLPRLIRLVRVLKLRKLFRSPRFQSYVLAIEYSPRIHPSVFRVAKVVAFLIVFSHICACLWFYVGYEDQDHATWVLRIFGGNVVDDPPARQYLVALYFVLTVATTIGFGDITPQSTAEIFVALFIMSVGATFFSYVVGTLASAVAAQDEQENEYRNRMNALITYMQERKDFLAVKVRSKVTSTMAVAWATNDRTTLADEYVEIMRGVPDSVRDVLHEEMFGFLGTQNALIKQAFNNVEFMKNFSDYGRGKKFKPGDILSTEGKQMTDVGFITHGSVDGVAIDGSILYKLQPGDNLGLPALMGLQNWPLTFRATSKTLVWFLPVARLLTMLEENHLLDKATPLIEEDVERYTKLATKNLKISQQRYGITRSRKLELLAVSPNQQAKSASPMIGPSAESDAKNQGSSPARSAPQLPPFLLASPSEVSVTTNAEVPPLSLSRPATEPLNANYGGSMDDLTSVRTLLLQIQDQMRSLAAEVALLTKASQK